MIVENSNKILPAWHSLEAEEALSLLGSSRAGLESEIVRQRQAQAGRNIIAAEEGYSKTKIFFGQFISPLIYILLAAVGLSLAAGESADAIVIAAAVFLNVTIGYFQEEKANNALKKLKSLIEYRALVRRGGRELEIPAEEIVVGDILVLRAGRFILADGRLLEASEIEVNEASLTGESSAVTKDITPVFPVTPLPDRRSMVYAGTSLVSGTGLAVVSAIGRATEIGKISDLVKKADSGRTPLQERLAGISKFLSLAAAAACLSVAAVGLLSGLPALEVFSAAVAVAVAAIPEGMSVAVTVILALGMEQAVKKKALTRKLLAAETLGSITVICSDKTGTLTEGVMRLEEIVTSSRHYHIKKLLGENGHDGLDDFLEAFRVGLLCNNAILENGGRRGLGSALEVAFLQAARNLGIDREELLVASPRLAELPFSSARKYMASLHQEGLGYNLYEKGAGEIIIKRCSFALVDGRLEKLSPTRQRELLAEYERLTAAGFRVIALASKKMRVLPVSLEGADKDWVAASDDLAFIAFASFKDPLRREAKKTISLCRQAGIRPIIITGDHSGTAAAIAAELKITTSPEEVISGEVLDKTSDEELRSLVRRVQVYARVSPEHKIRIVEALQANGEVVAMTGDGLNDSPALKAADIGVCLGSGTEVARETADLVLLDDNFSVIVGAVRQGRIIFDNIRKSLTYLVSDAFSEMTLIIGSIIFQTPLALLPVQILWINIVNDGLPNFALAFEDGDEDIMERRPLQRREPIFNREMKAIIVGIGLVRDTLLFGLFFFLYKEAGVLGWSLDYLRTLFFAILIMKSLAGLFSLRNFRRPLWHINHRRNRYLLFAVSINLALLVATVYLPLSHRFLKTAALGFDAWLIVIGVSLVNVLMIEAVKSYFARRHR